MPKLHARAGRRARIFEAVKQRCPGANGSQATSKRIFAQLQNMFKVIQGVEKQGRTNDALEKYKIVVADFLACTEEYQHRNVLQRLVHRRKMMNELERIQGLANVLFQMLSMEMAVEIEYVRQQWKAERSELNDQLDQLVEGSSVSLLELQTVRDAVLLLQNASGKVAAVQFEELEQLKKDSSTTIENSTSSSPENDY
ncbi:unnamed protein product [Phytophthora fragariaefolia]|uniref:Unnamed protein product n=1 Tax=Phytophthora fragariaefolia TaxID=1490495 RepID=A0A9W6XME2_9STRA|nr:unnamed protein product [Phytophthora fragariaefolia]